MKFTDVMKKPLTAPVEPVKESAELTLDDIEKELGFMEGADDAVAEEDADGIDPDELEAMVDDDDEDDMSDAELAALDAELSGDTLDDIAGVDDETEVTLSPEEEIEADDMMKIAATTALINDEMNAEERAEFVKNEKDVNTAINEGFLTESDVNMLAYEAGLVTEANLNQKMIIRLDAASRKKQLYAIAVNVSAAAHQDPDYYKYKKVMKAKKILRRKLEKKYHSEATKRMKVYFNRLKNSKSNGLAAIARKIK